MKTIDIKRDSANNENISTRIFIGESIFNLDKYIPSNSIIITDSNIYDIYGYCFMKFPVIYIKSGEESKSWESIKDVCQQLLKLNADRDTFLAGVGGGVVTDVTGFVASIYNRGLKFGFVSTTLLGQIDASIGGKNGINFGGFKNIIGTIKEPEFIISDILMLQSLHKKEILNGLAEMIKTAIIADQTLFEDINNNYDKILNLDNEYLEKIIYRTAQIKSDIVQKDKFENGLRRILNFGHTFAHAIESLTKISHGEAVSIGMITALKISCYHIGTDVKILETTKTLLQNTGLPVEPEIKFSELFNSILKDKKRYGEKIKFVLLKKIEEPVIQEIELAELEKIYNDLC